jgi:phosphatidylinositol alpha-1,6-mannosyltransferase
MTGMAGHWAAVGLLLVAGLGFAISLIVRPPLDAPAVAWRLALGLAVMFTLAPATRWGYFVYPIGLVGWLVLTRQPSAAENPGQSGIASIGVPAEAGKQGLSATAR